jgi:hypothetical protein
MIVSVLILILSVAMFFFYFQVTCQKIMRQQFAREYFRSVVKANGLEFLALRESLAQFGAPADYPRLREMLRCDFLALTYLLKNVGNAKARYSSKERLLILYFHSLFLSLAARRLLRFGEKQAILRMTSVLQYFSNVVGQRMDTVGFGNLAAAEYLPNL